MLYRNNLKLLMDNKPLNLSTNKPQSVNNRTHQGSRETSGGKNRVQQIEILHNEIKALMQKPENRSSSLTQRVSVIQNGKGTFQGRCKLTNQGISDLSLKNNLLALMALDESGSIAERKKIAESIQEPVLQKTVLEILGSSLPTIGDYIEAAASLEDKTQADAILLNIIQDPNQDLGIRKSAIDKLANPNSKDQGWTSLAVEPSLTVEQRIFYMSKVSETNPKLQYTTALHIIQNYKINDFDGRALLNKIKDPNVKEKFLIDMVRSHNLSGILRLSLFQDITKKLMHELGDGSSIDSLAQELCNDSSINISADLYKTLIDLGYQPLVIQALHSLLNEDTLEQLNNSARKKIAAAEALLDKSLETEHIDEAMLPILSDERIDINERLYVLDRIIVNPRSIDGAILENLVNDPAFNDQPALYRALFESLAQKGFMEPVLNAMNASFEGVEETLADTVWVKKVAAAQVILSMDPENITAVYIILTMLNLGLDSPYTLYKIVVDKSREIIELDKLLKENLPSIICGLGKNKKVYLNTKAFQLPSAMEAIWKDSFNAINLEYFEGQIRAIFEGRHYSLEQKMQHLDEVNAIEQVRKEIDENSTLQQDYLAYFRNPKRYTFQNALNSRKADSIYGNKSKYIVMHIQTLVDQKNFSDALGGLAELKINMDTCQGGIQQAIDMTYLNVVWSHDKIAQEVKGLDQKEMSLKIAEELILNVLYSMRLNWVLENEMAERNGEIWIVDSPERRGESFFEKLKALVSHPKDCFQNGSNHAFNNTHIGLAIQAIAGVELGLRKESANPSFDPECVSALKFIQALEITKSLIIRAFIQAFTFENIWKAIAKKLVEVLAQEAELTYPLFTNKDCTVPLDLKGLKDPLLKGAHAFLKSTGFEGEEIRTLFETKTYYFKDPAFNNEIEEIQLITGFSKGGIARVLEKLNLLSVV